MILFRISVCVAASAAQRKIKGGELSRRCGWCRNIPSSYERGTALCNHGSCHHTAGFNQSSLSHQDGIDLHLRNHPGPAISGIAVLPRNDIYVSNGAHCKQLMISLNNGTMGSATPLTQYAAFIHPDLGVSRIGHYDLAKGTIQPLSFTSGTPVSDLYQVIAAGVSRVIADGELLFAKDVKILPPISGRDILAVGKNYMEHAKEFNSSGFDSSDKTDRPSHPVIFTKRATSIIADGEEILPHPKFSNTVDYEGEIGVIIGKAGFQVSESDALDYVWGYTIINDVTARERQRDHKQFFYWKGPIAVPKEFLPSTLKVETQVNGELRQSATTDDLIFSIPNLIKTISEGQTLQPGDVIATGTPAGVGIGKKPPVYLKPGDKVAISVTGLGTLRNTIASAETVNSTQEHVELQSPFQLTNSAKTLGVGVGLTEFKNKKLLHYKRVGSGSNHIFFVHGLGGTMDYWSPLLSKLSSSDADTLHLFDLEGHGLSPTHSLSQLSIESFASDILSVFEAAKVTSLKPATLVAHSMGCLAAIKFTLYNPGLVDKLILIGPPPSPLPEAASKATYARATLIRNKGMRAVVDTVVDAGISSHTKQTKPIAVTAVRLSLLGQDPESYAKAAWALAGATEKLDVESITAKTLIITGDEDKVSPPDLCDQYAHRIKDSEVAVLLDVGHWHVFEDVDAVADVVREFLSKQLDKDLQPKQYSIEGTHSRSRILFTNVKILDSTGQEPYAGDVLIEGEKIVEVGQVLNKAELERDPLVRVFEGRGRTLMSGLGDGHTHFTWNGGDLNRLGELDVEEHVLLTMKSAQCFLDSGYTMCFGAAAAKDRLDVVVRDAINAGDIPGPRYLANAREIAKPEGELVAGITRFADGPEEMREVIKYNIETLGVDNIKLSISGEEITEIRSAQDCYFTDEEIIACVDEAHKRGMDMLEREREKYIVVPAINWLYATTYEAAAFGYTCEAAEKAGYKRELDIAVSGLREMHRRGIVILPGGDYGFAWTPHGTYARDLEHFVKLLGFTPHESIIAATAGVAALMMREDELGKIQPGYFADCILVDGDPLEDISILQDHERLNIIIMNGRVHKAGRNEYLRDMSGPLSTSVPYHLTEDFPEKRPAMQKSY
ncbi:hypothetical protein NM208_g2493 [Fusarium decemcellulare]|uniref:Uncharacterized protein n=1 Tax=Fusarium decemcellulare TaxID=57161 RepID=A0ACC1SSH0_9HYPO|nr:hypothetical protein NM208_g2493 [Fusarium decemcellulare]